MVENMLTTGSYFVDFALAVAFLLILLYWYIVSNNGYWDARGVPNVKTGLLMGSLTGKQTQHEGVLKLYRKFAGERFAGFFQVRQPIIMIRDLDLINKILVKDFTHFQDRGQPDVTDNALTKNLFNLKGQVWRDLRYKLTPTFTTGKLRGMFEQVSKCGDNMMEKIEDLSKGQNEIESKEFIFEFTLDVIASCAFGVKFKPNSPEFNQFKSITTTALAGGFFTFLRVGIVFLFPKLTKMLNISTSPQYFVDYFLNLTRSTLQYRKDNNIQRNDYFQLLMKLKEQEESGKDMGLTKSDATEEDSVVNQMQYAGENSHPATTGYKLFTEDTICANTFIFLLAGTESTATTISLVLFELTQHIDIQQRLHQEVDSVLASHGGWSYDTLKDMEYLEQVIQETQRLYPFLNMLVRECIKPYKIPDSDVVLEKGVLVSIPVFGLHKDPQYYPDPEQFKPERFEENKFKPNSAYLPFGDGPRMCIAMRFAVFEVKACVAKIMSQYSVKLSSKTKAPLQFSARSLTPTVQDGIWLLFEKRKPPK